MSEENHKGERIAKVMARAGLCSRRDAERWIDAGRVCVNGAVLDSPAVKVDDSDVIEVDGKVLQAAGRTRLFLYHKPVGLVTSHKDEQGRQTVFDSLPDGTPRLVSVGRLDLNTEGLLLLTNDGGLSRYLELPASALARAYRVRVLGDVDESALKALKNGITVEGVHYAGIKAHLESKLEGANRWVFMVLREGKNREIRRVMEALGCRVNRLIRVSYGPFELADLPVGQMVEVSDMILRDKLSGYFAR